MSTIRAQIFDLLADGRERSTAQIANELHELHGRPKSSVITACSTELALDHRVNSRREGRIKLYSIPKGGL